MYVKAEISEKEANHILSQKASFFPIRIKRKPVSLKRIELIYLPFYLFEILLYRETGKQNVEISLDGLLGSMLFFSKNDLSYEARIKNPFCPFVLSQSEAQIKAIRKYKWLLLEHGLRTRKMTAIEKVTGVKAIFYPFWVGYLKREQVYDFKAIDGVSGELQGVKMRKIFLKAFREMVSI